MHRITAADVKPGDVISLPGNNHKRIVDEAIPVSYGPHSPVREKEQVVIGFSSGSPWKGPTSFPFDWHDEL